MGIDLCATPLREARARAIDVDVISRCVFLQGDVLTLANNTADAAKAPHVGGEGGGRVLGGGGGCKGLVEADVVACSRGANTTREPISY